MKKILSFLPNFAYILPVFILSIFLLPTISNAASTTGYAWSENTGWIDFASTTVSDTGLSGYAYGENIGWINFTDSIVTNTSGVLSGYGWSENTGWINFSSTTINTSTGAFTGYAYGENIGWINFTDTFVTTSWRPPVVTTPTTPTYSGGGSGGYVSPATLAKLLATTTTATSTQICPSTLICTPISTSTPKIIQYTFYRNLQVNSEGLDVKSLQKYLNTKGYTIAKTGLGSKGNETTYFGNLTQSALSRFQKANNISPPVGFFGPLTRSFINNHP